MPDNSAEALEKDFSSKLQKGTVFHWKKFPFPDGARDKYLLVLSKNTQEELLICVLPTS